MLQKILHSNLLNTIQTRLNMDKLYELRLRAGSAVSVNYGGKYYYLNSSGLSENSNSAFQCSYEMINQIVLKATDFSIYAATKNINSGFITINGGIRL
ncbi:MAG: hypothetical protein LBU60_06865, partial [Clostridiales bacterium]|nr:hypothetical protein [Clostridiales bacterium]